jgi:subtilisin family serine protease
MNHSGKDISGQDVVIAVVDAGFQVDHLDLKDNIWINQNEIQDNKIDDDANGYVDDVYGWNAYKDNGKIKSDTHGTHVLGIMGAVGNNKLGITGVNGKIKMMLVMGATEKTSTLIKAYSYILEQKKLWIESHGRKGANIVATNSSFGVDDGDCTKGEFPLWNEMYNKLGEVGILSAVATINDNVNVDVKGDVPSGCKSPYIISVTNTNKKNQKFLFAGYGKKSIHLAAPGEDIFSTFPRNSYAYLTGTSMATPHVAGAIGLLHIYANQNFNQLYLNKPSDAALQLKDILLSTVDPLPSLTDITITGGRLNVENAVTKIVNY